MQSYKKKNYTPRFDGARIWQGFGKGLGEKNSGGRESNTRAPYLVRQSCRTRRKSNRRSFFAEGADYVSKRFPGKRESHKEKNCPRGLTAPGFGKGLGEKNLGGRASGTRAPYLVRQSCRTRRKSNHRSFSAAKVRELSKLSPGKRELHGEKDYTPRLDGARIFSAQKG